MRRIIFHIAALLSLIISVTAAGAWVRARQVSDRWYWNSDLQARPDERRVRNWNLVFAGGAVLFDREAIDLGGKNLPLANRFRHEIAPASSSGILQSSYLTPLPNGNGMSSVEHKPINVWGFVLRWGHGSWSGERGRFSTFDVLMPLWFPAAVFAILPVLWEISHRRRCRCALRIKKGLCPTCGYDLRATPERCPECGTAAVVAKAPLQPQRV